MTPDLSTIPLAHAKQVEWPKHGFNPPPLATGQIWERPCPFIKKEGGWEGPDNWVPGVNYYEDGSEHDGDGIEIRRVVDIYRPAGVWPRRVFFIRQYRDPGGREFGKLVLRISTLGVFNQWLGNRKGPLSDRRTVLVGQRGEP